MDLPSRSIRADIRSLLILIIIAGLAGSCFLPNLVQARERNWRERRPYRSILLVEAETGKVLKSENPRQREIPASIVKMMTILLALESIKAKTISMQDEVVTSRRASKMGGQQVYLKQGESFPLEKLLQAVAISSANDAAYAVAEHVAGDVPAFVQMMNDRAKQLGMTDTEFLNPHGLPPGRNKRPNWMSARDAAILARELLKYPIVTEWGSTKHAPFRDGTFTLTNTNRLVGRYSGLDGLKTGSYRRAGYSIVATAKRGNLRLIAVVLSSDRPRRRFTEVKKLLNWGFSRYHWYTPPPQTMDQDLEAQIEKGQKDSVHLKPEGNFRVLVRRGDDMKIAVRTEIPETRAAPVSVGQRIGRIIYEIDGKSLGEIYLTAAESVEEKRKRASFGALSLFGERARRIFSNKGKCHREISHHNNL